MKNRDKGLRGLMQSHRTPEEVKSDELQQFYQDHIEDKKPIAVIVPEDDTLYDTPTITVVPPQKTVAKPKETPFRYEGWGEGLEERTRPKNKFGHTASQKDKMILDQITRPPDNNKKILKAKPKAMPMNTYIDKMSVLYAGQEKRKIDDQGYPLKATPDQMQGLQNRLDNARQMTSETEARKSRKKTNEEPRITNKGRHDV